MGGHFGLRGPQETTGMYFDSVRIAAPPKLWTAAGFASACRFPRVLVSRWVAPFRSAHRSTSAAQLQHPTNRRPSAHRVAERRASGVWDRRAHEETKVTRSAAQLER